MSLIASTSIVENCSGVSKLTTTTVLEDVVFVFLVYKQSQYLRTTLPSAINQTQYPGLLLVMDDASPDDSAKVIEQILADAPKGLNVQFEHNQENIGLIAQLNKLVNRFENKLIVLQAGDDESYPNRLEETYKAWVEQGKPSLVLANYDGMNELGQVIEPFDHKKPQKKYTLDRLIARRAMVYGCCAAFDSDLINFFGDIPVNVINEDRINAFRAWFRNGICYIHKPLLRYRLEGGVSHFSLRTKADRIYKSMTEFQRELIDLDAYCLDLDKVFELSRGGRRRASRSIHRRRRLVRWCLMQLAKGRRFYCISALILGSQYFQALRLIRKCKR
jgi:glycosyltransferase involved in cell wall biosynthesis